MNYREKIGNRIREIMLKKGISSYQLAELTGYRQPNINAVINGRYSTGIDILGKIADALNCDVDFIEK